VPHLSVGALVSRDPDCVLAWSLSEGDLLPGGEKVLSVQRDAYTGRVWVASDDGSRRELRRDDRVVVARRAAAAVTRPGWWRPALFIGTVRRARRAASRP
jgi:hypothetical protein